MPAWPGTLPQYISPEGYGEQEADNLIRTPMSSGPAKIRPRSTAAPRIHNWVMDLTEAQYSAFKSFYRNDCVHGSLTFTRNDAHGVSKTWRFLSLPSYSHIGYDHYQVQFSVEEMF